VSRLADLVAVSHAAGTLPIVAFILRTSEPEPVAATITAAVSDAVGSGVVDARFYEPGVGVVVGLELDDGRMVVAKLHRNTYTSRDRLAKIARVQRDLASAGLPAPAPVAWPVAVGHGWLTVEDHCDGQPADGYDPAIRREMAGGLRRFAEAGRHHAKDGRLGSWLTPPVIDDLWPEPHDLRFDFVGTSSGAEWIDEAARAARRILTSTSLPPLVGHLDWRVQNLGFHGGRLTAIYDWDSVALVPAAALVGVTSVVHPIDWRLGLADPLPSVTRLDGFVTDYELARGDPFDDAEHEVLTAAQRWIASYGARTQHSDHLRGLFPGTDQTKG
jgi:hypothetical protein